MLGLLHNVEPADLVAFAREVPVREDFALTQAILAPRTIRNVKYRTRNSSITVNAAKFRAFNAPTPFISTSARRSFREGYLPPLGGKEAIEEFEVILQEISRGADDQSLLDAIYDNVQNQVLAIRSRLELAAGDLLTDGIITIDENGQNLDADFGVPAAHKPTAAILWDQPGARHLSDEMAWMQQMADGGAAVAGQALTSRRVRATFANSDEYKTAYWGTSSDLANRPALTLAQVNQVRESNGLVPIREYDVAIPVEGTLVRPIPESQFILLPAQTSVLGSTTFGLTAEGMVLSSGSNPHITQEDSPGIISTAEEHDDPVAVTTKSTAVALPILDAPAAIVTAKVLA